jgi:hypothetical protein
MTEADWLACRDPTRLILGLRGALATRRQVRLAMCACFRRWELHLSHKSARQLLEVNEQYADGRTDIHKLNAAVRAAAQLLGRREPHNWTAEEWLVDAMINSSRTSRFRDHSDAVLPALEQHVAPVDPAVERAAQLALIDDIFANPFRPVSLYPCWLTTDVIGLARGIYDERAFERMPILADALMDAGCEDEQILGHCRGEGPHVRGCWVVDLVLDKK